MRTTEQVDDARGRPRVPADVMATVITLQALLGMSDVEAVTR